MAARKKAANDAYAVVSDSIHEMPVGELANLTEQSHSAVSQHLAKLRAADLVESRRDAQTIYYRCSGGVGRALINTLCDYYR